MANETNDINTLFFNENEFDLQDLKFDSLNLSHNVPNAQQKNNLKSKIKQCFTEDEDCLLSQLVYQFGTGSWIQISKQIGTRSPRQCRERWNNYINPELRKDSFTIEEDQMLRLKVAEFGKKWNKISKFFEKRSDNSLRNRWMVLSRNKSKLQPISFPYNTNIFKIQPLAIPEVMTENQKKKFECECNLIKQSVENIDQENKTNFYEFDRIRIDQAESNWEEFELFQF
jgi:hypothetical protein